MSKANKILLGVFVALVIAAVFLIINIHNAESKNTNTSNSSSVGTANDEKSGSDEENSDNSQLIADAFKNKQSDIEVEGEGTVIKLLPDDTKGNEHQKFIIELSSGQTLMFAHNISISDKIIDLKEGDFIKFSGEYVWNDEGGLIHWTHHDPDNKHGDGWIEHNGKRYD